MKEMKGCYLKDNNYYVGSMDTEKKLIWVSIEGSEEFTEFPLQEDAQGNQYFMDQGHRVNVDFA